MPPRGGGGRSYGGGGYHGGRRASGSTGGGKSGSKGGEFKSRETIIHAPPGRSGGHGVTYKYDTETFGEPWYNTVTPEERWERALAGAILICPKYPDSFSCQKYLEWLVDLPPETREAHSLPPILYPDSPVNDPPLKLPVPHDPCKMWTRVLQVCREHWTHFDSHWKCVPYEGFVQEVCSGDNQKA